MKQPDTDHFWRTALLLCAVHAVGDFYAMFCAPMLPVLREEFGLTLRMTQTLGTFYLIVQNFSQPLLGLLSERWRPRYLVAVGLGVTALGMSALGLAGGYGWAFLALAIGGLGVGLFHPTGAAIAGDLLQRRSAAMTVFMVGGNLGIMTAPIVVTAIAARDPRYLFALCLPGLAAAGFLLGALKHERPPRVQRTGAEDLGRTARRLAWLHLRVVLRFVPLQILLLFLPLYCTTKGYSETEAGQIQSFGLLMSAAGVLVGGWATGRLPRKVATVGSEVLAGLALLALPLASPRWFIPVLSAAYFFGYFVFPLQIVMAQEAAPRAKGAAAGVVMGLAYGNASLLLFPLNWLAAYWAGRTGSEFRGMSLELRVAAIGIFLAALMALCAPLRKDGEDAARDSMSEGRGP